MKKEVRKCANGGITLISLVITIIVLIILAGISIQLLLGENGIITRAKEAKIMTDKENAREKVVMAVGGSYGDNGTININKLKENLQKTETVTGAENITVLPTQVKVDGYNVIIKKNGEVILDGELNEEVRNEPIYARLYKKNGTDEEVLILGSKESSFQDYSSELTLSDNFGDINNKRISIEDLYEIPEYAEILNSEEWKQFQEEFPEYAQFQLDYAMTFPDGIPWLKYVTGSYSEKGNYYLTEVRILDEIFPFDLSNWFARSGLAHIENIEKINTSNVMNMNSMFFACEHLTNLDLSGFDTSKVQTMTDMFNYCNNLISLNLSSFDTSKVQDMGWMFSNCSKLTEILVGKNWEVNIGTNTERMFENCGVSEVTYVTEKNN